MIHCAAQGGHAEQERTKEPGFTGRRMGGPKGSLKAYGKKQKRKKRKISLSTGNKHQEGRTGKEITSNGKEKARRRKEANRGKYKKKKTAHPKEKENGKGTRGKAGQVKTSIRK